MEPVYILGVPLDLGAGRRGVDMGPSAVRVAGLHHTLRELGHQIIDCGDLSIPIAETRSFGQSHLKFLHEITETCSRLAQEVSEVFRKGGVPPQPQRRLETSTECPLPCCWAMEIFSW